MTDTSLGMMISTMNAKKSPFQMSKTSSDEPQDVTFADALNCVTTSNNTAKEEPQGKKDVVLAASKSVDQSKDVKLSVKATDKKADDSKDTFENKDYLDDANQTKSVASKDDGKKKVSEDSGKESVSEAKEMVETEELEKVEEVDETLLETIASLLLDYSEEVLTVLEQELGVDKGDILAKLDELNLNLFDLTDTSNLATLVQSFEEEQSPLAILTSDSFIETSNQIQTLTEELLGELGMTMDEVMDTIQKLPDKEFVPAMNLEEAPKQDTLPTLNLQDVVKPFVKSEVKEEKPMMNQKEDLTANNLTDNENVSKVEVVKENEDTNHSSNQQSSSNQQEATMVTESTDSESKVKTDDFASEEKDVFKVGENHEQVAEQFATHETVTITNPDGSVMVAETRVVELQNLVQELTDYIRLSGTADGINAVQLQINPEHIGKLIVEVSTNQGEITAKITAQNELAKEAIEANLSNLKTNLENSGVKVTAVEVTVESHAFEQNLSQNQSQEQQRLAEEMREQNSHKRMNLNLNEMTLEDLTGLMSEEDLVVAKMMKDNGNTLNITA